MNHASMIARGRKQHVHPAACLGELEPLQTRRHWARDAAERLYHCKDCGAVLGMVGEHVEWSMSAVDWKGLA